MKISCLPVSLFPQIIEGSVSIGEYAAFAARLGLDAIDMNAICVKNHTESHIGSVRKSIEEAGVGLTMLTTYTDFTHPSEEQRERELAYCISDIALASQLGAEFLRITAGQAHPSEDVDGQLEMVAGYFKRCREWALRFGVELLYENHSKPGAWEMPDILFDPDNFLKLSRALADTDIGINYDTANSWLFGADPVEVLAEVAEKVKTIHVNDAETRHTLKFTEIGQGNVPIEEIVSYAREKGFDGWLCIEEASGHGFEGIERSVSWVKETLSH